MDLPSSTHYAKGSLRFSRYTSMHYTIGWCRVVFAINSPMRVDARSCMNVFGASDNKYCRRSRCGMSDVAFRTAPTNWWAFLLKLWLHVQFLHARIAHVTIALHSFRRPAPFGDRPSQREAVLYLEHCLTQNHQILQIYLTNYYVSKQISKSLAYAISL